MRIYLAKSNRCDADLYIRARAKVLEFSKKNGHDLMEHTGGTYNAEKLKISDILVVVPQIERNGASSHIIIGKGIYSEIRYFNDLLKRPIYILSGGSDSSKLGVFKFDDSYLRITDHDSWVFYAEYRDRVVSSTLTNVLANIFRDRIVEKHREDKGTNFKFVQKYDTTKGIYFSDVHRNCSFHANDVVEVETEGSITKLRIETFEVSRNNSKDYRLSEDDRNRAFSFVYAVFGGKDRPKVHLSKVHPVAVADKYSYDFIL